MTMTPTFRLLAASLALFTAACSTGVDLPKGSSSGYSSARLVKTGKTPEYADDNAAANRMIQQALADEFRSHGLQVGSPDSDLVVAYLILVQDNFSTLALDDYFGYGRDLEAIVDKAQDKGVVTNPRPDQFESGTIVIDVMDAKTNKLVYRNYASRDLTPNASSAVRQQRIREAVAQALDSFFR